MQRSVKLFAALQASIADYVDYLQQADRELPSLHEIFPKSNAVEDVVKFHASLCAAMEANALPLVGIKVLPPTYEAVVSLRGTQPVCVPVFSNLLQRGPTSIRKDRLQYIDATVCLEVENLVDGCDTAEGALANTVAFAPGIEVSGSRYPFYAPTISAMACDLAGCVNITKGNDVRISRNAKQVPEALRFVLTRNEEPIQVGSLKACLDSPFTIVTAASAYAKAMQAPRKKSLLVFCEGVCPRTPVQIGTYAFEWGRFGRMTYSVQS